MDGRGGTVGRSIWRQAGTAVEGAFDAIVVGSGPGGATAALELTRLGWRVLILEMGRNDPVTGGMAQTLRELWMPGRSLFLTDGLLAVLRGVTVGGSSIYFWGTAWEPPYGLFAKHGIDIRDEVEEVKRHLPTAPLPQDLMGPAARRLMESANDLGYAWRPLPKFYDQARLGGPPMGSYGAPSYEAKWNARMFVDEAVALGATLLTGAAVRRVLVEDGVATGVEFVRRGETLTARAPEIVVAAGGIGSPRILRASGVDGAGRSFFCDPLVAVVGTLPGVGRGLELPMVGGAVVEEEGYMLTDMSVPRWVYSLITAQVGRVDRLAAYRDVATIMVKIRDDVQGCLGRSGGIRKRLTPADRGKLGRGAERARAILRHAGAKGIFRTLPFAAHPGGAVPIGRLVDSDLATEIRGLHVCDASVIPDPWGLPPTLTLIGLAMRLARHLAVSTIRPSDEAARFAAPLRADSAPRAGSAVMSLRGGE